LPIYTEAELDYQRLVKAARRLQLGESAAIVKLAILADCAVPQLAILIKGLLGQADLRAEIYEGAFDAIEIETRAPDSGLYRFGPEAVIILNSTQALAASYSRSDAGGFAKSYEDRILGAWDAIQSHCNATILQSTFAMPLESHFGNFEITVPTSLHSSVAALNAGMARAARDRAAVLFHDVDAVASWVGRRHFFDGRAWDLWKAPCSLEYLPRIAKNIVDVLLALRGRVVKCVVVDLDNTLWGGVIGDDGIDGIVLSAHGGGPGESFVRLQMFLKQLRQRGILLAVCSKNEEATALAPFLHHPDMVLKREDISAFVADWQDKAAGIQRIREELNIGLDSIVFLDDNAFERNLVRDLLPGVIVPELPEDPSNVVSYLSALNLFETTTLSREDLERTALYGRESERRKLAAGSATVQDFLHSLDMQLVLSRFDRFHLPRIAQLLQRSNQFNLCTRRLTESECAALMDSSVFVPLYAKLADRFGDHGLISVVVLESGGNALMIRDWLMSCRVLARGVEQFMMNQVVALAMRMGLNRVMGEYIPTDKNGMVRDFFQQFGFTRVPAASNQWSLDVGAYQSCGTFIRLAGAAEFLP
jgi:FkbH-like protein